MDQVKLTPQIEEKLSFLEKNYNLKGNNEEKLLELIEFYIKNKNNKYFHDVEGKNNLPDQLTSLIVSYLPLKSILNFSLASKKFSQIILRQDTWV